MNETEILTANGVTKIDDDRYSVPSSDGTQSYTVRFVGRTEDGCGLLWDCDCPAGRHGKTCKHVHRVGDAASEVAAEFGQE